MHENIVAKNQCDEASVLSGVAVVRDLPPLHRRYAVRRGMAALGLRGAPPPIDDLMVAAVPPSPPRVRIWAKPGHAASKKMFRDEHDDAKDMADTNDDFQPTIGHFAPIRLRVIS